MSKEYIRNNNGRTIGWIDDTGSQQHGYNDSGRRLGTYYLSEDRTRDSNGARRADGNILAAMIWQDAERRRVV